jgi:hypothetical protein
MCIYVRDITNEEGVQLKRILRRSNDSFRVKRAQVILASAQKMGRVLVSLNRYPECHQLLDSTDMISQSFCHRRCSLRPFFLP